MTFATEIFPAGAFAEEAARRILRSVPPRGSVVLTGGRAAEHVYGVLTGLGGSWSAVDLYFSDERCVPPDDDRSNFAMAQRTLLAGLEVGGVHRMRGEDEPEAAAGAYDDEVGPAVQARLDLVLLGMGEDCHVAGLFPGSPAVIRAELLCAAVDRPDGLKGLTLTPLALVTAREILLIVEGEAKAEAVARAVNGTETPEDCPARLLADHSNATFLLDEPAASGL